MEGEGDVHGEGGDGRVPQLSLLSVPCPPHPCHYSPPHPSPSPSKLAVLQHLVCQHSWIWFPHARTPQPALPALPPFVPRLYLQLWYAPVQVTAPRLVAQSAPVTPPGPPTQDDD
jgi:hypothetical protein